ncbi:MAG: hypothetical protein HZB55_09995 [Deltaproteobacteria bacterium]|nr:hypothetical protein [Deltaproteobacteria bacterium]
MRERARLVARAAVKMGAAAVTIGRQDLLDGLPALEALGRNPGVPWVAANLRRRQGTFPFPRWRTVQWGGRTVGIFGLVRPEPDQDARLGLEVSDPEAAAREAVKELRGVDAILALSSLGLAEEQRLAAAVPGITAIVGGGSGEYLAAPQTVGNTLILHAAEKGKHVGVLEVPSAALGRGWAVPRNLQERVALEARRAAAGAEIAGLGGGTEKELIARAGNDPQRLAQTQSALRTLADVDRALADFDQTRSVYSHRIVTLEPSVGEDAEVASWVRDFKASESTWNQAAGPRPVVPAPVPSPPPGTRRAPAGAPLHTGSTACRACHAEAYRRWLGTAHSRAYLALRGKELEPACLACHSSALTRLEGPQLEPDVGCEACHGAGGNHRSRGNIARRPPERLCRRCHRGFHKDEKVDIPGGFEKVRCDRK